MQSIYQALTFRGYVEDPLSLSKLRFVSADVKATLGRLGLHSLWQLVEHGLTAKERRSLAERAGLEEGVVLKLVRLADFCRVCDLELAELLVEAGAHTPFELPLRPLDELCQMVLEATQRLGVNPPSREKLEEVKGKARMLPPLFDY
ncbi:MAG: DUF4332 domain-containing protein [Thermofilaceae archaeon]